MSKNIILFGSTGFVGEGLLSAFLKNEWSVVTPVRKVNNTESNDFKEVQFDLSKIFINEEQNNNLLQTIKDLEDYIVVYSVGLIKEDSKQKYSDFHYFWLKNLIDLIKNNPPEKFVLISALGVNEATLGSSTYYGSKRLGELELIKSGFNYKIIRPSIVWDDLNSNKYSFKKELEKLTKFLIVPVIGSGKSEFQPINLSELCNIVLGLITNETNNKYNLDDTNNKIIFAVGDETITFKNLLKKVAKGRKLYVHTPYFLIYFLAVLFDRFKFFPISREQLKMLVEGNSVLKKSALRLNLKVATACLYKKSRK